MSNIIAEISQELQEIFQDLTGDASVSITVVEDQVSSAVSSWAQRLSRSETQAWQTQRNAQAKGVDWQFTTQDARTRLKRLYPQF